MKIFFDADVSEVIAFAAEELTRYLTQMVTDLDKIDMEIKLCSDSNSFEVNSNDSYRVEISQTQGSIIGNNDRSVLLAVYNYLYVLGCRFLMPLKTCEIIPHIERERLVTSYEKHASYFHRGVCIEGADSFENIMDYIEWLPKVGFNSFFLQFQNPYAFLKRWYEHLENPYVKKENYTPEDAQRDMVLLEQAAKKRGLFLHKVGHGWTGEVLGYRTVSWDAQTQPKQESVCHRMAMINGKRELFKGIPANTNLCYHNADAIDAFATIVTSYAKENPHIDYLHVWLADEFNNLCECPECSKTTVADQYVELLNEIDQRLTKASLDTRIVFLLYQELLWPPVVNRLNNPDRFVLMFAPISRTFEKSYEIENVDVELPIFHRNQITLPVNLTENMVFLKAWQKIFSGDSFVYDYPLGRAHYGDLGYIHIARVLHADIQKLEEMGLNGYISCQELRAALPNALPSYVMGHTLFQKDCSIDELIQDYFQSCYGKDAQSVLTYLSKLSEFSSCDYVNGKGERFDYDMAKRMEGIALRSEAFEKEIKRHKNTDGVYESIYWELLEYHRKYAIFFADALMFLAMGDQKCANLEWEAMRDYICKNEQKYQPYLDVYRVLEVTQKYTKLHPQK